MAEDTTTHDLIVIGATAGGLSVAEAAHRAGVERVHILERGESVLMPEVIGRNDLAIGYGEKVSLVDIDDDGMVIVASNRRRRKAKAVVIAEREYLPESEPPIEVEANERVTVDNVPSSAGDADVMVIGISDHAVELTSQLAAAGANVVLAADGLDPARLSPVAGEMLATLERERRATVLYRSTPNAIGERGGFPMAYFPDRRTPDLEFDHIVFASSRAPADLVSLGVTDAAKASDGVWLFSGKAEEIDMHGAFGPDLWPSIAAARFPDAVVEPYGVRSWSRDTTLADELAEHFLQRNDHVVRANPLRSVASQGAARPRRHFAPSWSVRDTRTGLLGGTSRWRDRCRSRRQVAQDDSSFVLDLEPDVR